MRVNAPITVGVDGSAESDAAVRWAAEEALRRGCGLLLAAAYDPAPSNLGYMAVPPDLVTPLHDAAASGLEMAVGVAEQVAKDTRRELSIESRLVRGNPREALIDLSRHAATLVVGVRGIGRAPFGLIGSTAWALAGHAKCPVVIVHEHPVTRDSAEPVVVVGVDGSPDSASAIDIALTEAGFRGATLVAVHGWAETTMGPVLDPFHGLDQTETENAARTLLSDELARHRDRHPNIVVRPHLVCDRPVTAIAAAAEGADLLVVGSRGRGGFTSLLLGSTSHGLLNSVTCPLMIVH